MMHLKYLWYLLRHKLFVLLAGIQVGVPLWRLIVHDWSKFLPCQWMPYATFFYARLKPAPQTQENFDRAWLHHIHLSAHHWQHWIMRDSICLEMPTDVIHEMVADWMGAGRAITGSWDIRKWYEDNQSRIRLAPRTRIVVELLIDNLY